MDPVMIEPVGPEPVVVNPNGLMAPAWHTLLLIVILVAFSFMGAVSGHPVAKNGPLSQYLMTIAWEWILLTFVWWGVRMKGVTIRELIGGRWAQAEDFLMDVAMAFGFWIASAMVLAGLGYLMGFAQAAKVEEARKQLEFMIPHSNLETVVGVLLSITAGFCEEIIFRGYLQKQFAAMTKNAWLGILISGVCFGSAHGYEGWRRMILIAVFGMMFGVLAHFRKSLRPGMMAHAFHDSLAMIALRFVKNFA